ncbi:hypothetical protein [Lihuaxuella thermophila]|uniref:Uncharacterized protein n=1 Tax=Lihuaxuella thermophila TaxID=1173111 RepID=A0A1H8IQZ3_9BACL|nr:hypothetical protein [Lihuaxuella thermophila]SEN70994.1 hypothetical protein SAMN05444955_1199 [Lihuaxuella thermophila]
MEIGYFSPRKNFSSLVKKLWGVTDPSHAIPGLAEETADSIRKEIELYARLYDEHV